MSPLPLGLFVCLLASNVGFAWGEASDATGDRIDAGTLHGKVMVGYRGDLNAEGDGAGRGWAGWSRKPHESVDAENLAVAVWPDLEEFGPHERYSTDLANGDGTVAEVFSSRNRATVKRHFEWMRTYGIDGAFVHRIAADLMDPRSRENADLVLTHAREAAHASGRVYGIYYDLNGLRGGEVAHIQNDWDQLRHFQRLTDDPSYLKHGGAPVVAISGIGFEDRDFPVQECLGLVAHLKKEGCALVVGVPADWRERGSSEANGALMEVLKLADVISPEGIGEYRTAKQAALHGREVWSRDRLWCIEHRKGFLPVIFPGYDGSRGRQGRVFVPRAHGKFYWAQFVAARRAGAQMVYVATFDGMSEGTAVLKMAVDPPREARLLRNNGGGLPSDYYLQLTGEGARHLNTVPLNWRVGFLRARGLSVVE